MKLYYNITYAQYQLCARNSFVYSFICLRVVLNILLTASGCSISCCSSSIYFNPCSINQTRWVLRTWIRYMFVSCLLRIYIESLPGAAQGRWRLNTTAHTFGWVVGHTAASFPVCDFRLSYTYPLLSVLIQLTSILFFFVGNPS